MNTDKLKLENNSIQSHLKYDAMRLNRENMRTHTMTTIKFS